ncbi:hypothetical protein AWB69_04466 [Caballeronia udeis]|uniref:Uncharacterized protein n=1 Tax=Caballeronia udeis TaxID=1232866 RepID=A0A158HJE3_9BURK|nr:hypothetical protein AWB69_04466 [Caballeronia udeis]
MTLIEWDETEGDGSTAFRAIVLVDRITLDRLNLRTHKRQTCLKHDIRRPESRGRLRA